MEPRCYCMPYLHTEMIVSGASMTRAWLSLRCLCSSVHSPLSSNAFKEGLILLETSMSKPVTSFPERRDEYFIVCFGCPFQNGWVLAAKSPCPVLCYRHFWAFRYGR